jgi:TMEM175 potassium channel family protein
VGRLSPPAPRASFTKTRLEAFSDGVLAIIITVMVLELKAPQHAERFADLEALLPAFLSYALSFIYLGIYWNNHHHMLHAASRVTGGVLWANLHLLFWLSLTPFSTAWMGENQFAPAPTAVYGIVLLLSAFAYLILQTCIVRAQEGESVLSKAVGHDVKGKISPLLYLAAIGLSFVRPWFACALYFLVALIWLIPDRRIEHAIASEQGS